jgi:hypothetical protein
MYCDFALLFSHILPYYAKMWHAEAKFREYFHYCKSINNAACCNLGRFDCLGKQVLVVSVCTGLPLVVNPAGFRVQHF